VARLVGNNRLQKDTCHDEIGLCAQDIDTLLGSIVTTNWEGLCGFEENENLFFISYKFACYHRF